jgi:hypothetical protein
MKEKWAGPGYIEKKKVIRSGKYESGDSIRAHREQEQPPKQLHRGNNAHRHRRQWFQPRPKQAFTKPSLVGPPDYLPLSSAMAHGSAKIIVGKQARTT